jgi:hypothetical protein
MIRGLWYSNKILELEQYLKDFVLNPSDTHYESQVKLILPEAYLLLGMTYEKLNLCKETVEVYYTGTHHPFVPVGTFYNNVMRTRYESLKCIP